MYTDIVLTQLSSTRRDAGHKAEQALGQEEMCHAGEDELGRWYFKKTKLGCLVESAVLIYIYEVALKLLSNPSIQ